MPNTSASSTFDLSTVVRNMAGPSNPHRRCRPAAGRSGASPDKVENEPGPDADGAVIIAAITSCTNTSNPRNVVAAGLLARKANALGLVRKPWVKSSFAPGSERSAPLYLEEAGLLPNWKTRLRHRRGYACTTCNGMSGALDPVIQQEIIDRDLYATAVLSGNRNFDGRIHPVCQAGVPGLAAAGRRPAIAGTIRFDIENDAGNRQTAGRHA